MINTVGDRSKKLRMYVDYLYNHRLLIVCRDYLSDAFILFLSRNRYVMVFDSIETDTIYNGAAYDVIGMNNEEENNFFIYGDCSYREVNNDQIA